MAKVGVIGAGSWGIALAKLLRTNGNEVMVWSIVEEGGRCHEHDEDDGTGHTNRRIQLFGNAQERADTVELHQHVVVDQDHAEEDRSEFY